jgi:hypothetical protein
VVCCDVIGHSFQVTSELGFWGHNSIQWNRRWKKSEKLFSSSYSSACRTFVGCTHCTKTTRINEPYNAGCSFSDRCKNQAVIEMRLMVVQRDHASFCLILNLSLLLLISTSLLAHSAFIACIVNCSVGIFATSVKKSN